MAKTKAVEPARKLSLYEIERGWIPLLEARIEAETDPEISDERPLCRECDGRTDPECPNCDGTGFGKSPRELAIEAADVALADHSSREIDKVDGYIGVLSYIEGAIAARKAAAKRNQTAARILENMVEQIKASAVYAISAVPGRKRVEGESGYLLVKGNGGLQPLMVQDPDLVPDELCRLEGSIGAKEFGVMVEATRRRLFSPDWRPMSAKFTRVPDNAAIREKLSEPCPDCIAGVVVSQDAFGGVVQDQCKTCGGTGKHAVPGAYLAERGEHLEVR